MKVKSTLAACLIAAAFFVIGTIQAENEAKMHEQTLKNLSTAMHGEAFAYAKYMLFAQQARKDGHAEVANLFESTAKTEWLEHFAEEAELARIVKSDSSNLQDSIAGESYETETMYRDFAQQATQVGDTAAARRFEEIRKDEAKHRDAYKSALAKLEQKPK